MGSVPLLLTVLHVALGSTGPRGGFSPCGEPGPVASELVSAYPPCFEVTLEADVSGLPPFEVTWTLPGGSVLTGNPVVLDTGLLPTGFSEVVLAVSNDHGTVTHPVALSVEPLAFSSPPSFTVVEGTTVQARANTTGATEWRWSWGDGTTTAWLSGCDGFAPTHTYPAPGTYAVQVDARSCRDGPLTATGTLDLGSVGAPLIERFQARCSTEPFCAAEAGQALAFDSLVSGPVDTYLYDWTGDGFDDEVGSEPIPAHVFASPGFYTPRLTVVSGSSVDIRYHPAPIEVFSTSTLLFADDFESGDLRHWSLP